MNKAFIQGHNIISALGKNTDEVVGNLRQSKSGIAFSGSVSAFSGANIPKVWPDESDTYSESKWMMRI